MISRLLRTVDDLRPAWPAVEVEFRKIESEQFATEGGAGSSGKWPALSLQYKAWKERHFPGAGILVRTEALRGSLIGRGAGSYVRTEQKRLTLGTSVAYASFHQAGASRLPRRPEIAPSNAQAARLQAVLNRYFNAEIRRLATDRVGVQSGLIGN